MTDYFTNFQGEECLSQEERHRQLEAQLLMPGGQKAEKSRAAAMHARAHLRQLRMQASVVGVDAAGPMLNCLDRIAVGGSAMGRVERARAWREAREEALPRHRLARRLFDAETACCEADDAAHADEILFIGYIIRVWRDRSERAQKRLAMAKRDERDALRGAGAAAEALALIERLNAEKELERCLNAIDQFEALRSEREAANGERLDALNARAVADLAEMDRTIAPLLEELRAGL